jgi:hypothetical protein
MYNMEITIFGMKIRLEIIVLIVIAYFVLFGHVLCSCSRVNIQETMETIADAVANTEVSVEVKKKPDPKKEGFTNLLNDGESSKFSLQINKPVDTSSWFTQNLSYKKGGEKSQGIMDILNRPKQPVPLPEGEMLMFANTPFKPECCPNAYSNSTGCACMTTDQYNYLIDRGGNNVPYSEY